jgi:solute carrier family 25 protein 39/40
LDVIKTKLQTQNVEPSYHKIIFPTQNINNNNLDGNSIIKDKINNSNNNTSSDINKNNSNSNSKKESEVKYKNIWSTTKIIYREHGFFKGFFKGVVPRMMANVPSCAISWGTYETIKYFLLNVTHKQQ